MKTLIPFVILILLFSCYNGQKIIERKYEDGSDAKVKSGKFSGIDYLYVEKKLYKNILYKLYYDCECGFDNKIALRKDYVNSKRDVTLWTAVTDTTGQPKFFDEVIEAERLFVPTVFMPINQEEINLLEEAISKIDKQCCKNPNKPVNQVIGYLRLKLN